MLSAEKVDQAARHLLAARKAKTPGPAIPESYRPADADSALAIQERVLELLGEKVGGWKCGVPNPLTGPIVAAIPASAILRSQPCAVPGKVGLIEPEIAFVIAHDLPPRATPYSDAEIRAAIAEARMVLELITTRYADKASATPSEILADSYNHHGLLIGPVIPHALDHPLERLHVTIQTPAGMLFDQERAHPSGHPMKAFTWLVHFLNSRGQGLKAGEIVTTGSYAGIVEAPLGVPIQVKLDTLGSLQVELITDKP
ncbi:MAG TPA: fumarylacetoacetate hydrolase family protein [Bryobacteraceae bacterium]|nr:fumarylacetoacetate hydrolase family protein [Bryobacteraceae bacterium]